MVKKTWRETPGPWLGEPDEQSGFAHGLQVIARRHPQLGHWCGYVAIQSDAQINVGDLNVHGGVTYNDECVPGWTPVTPCSIRAIGFDCAHSGDLIPSTAAAGLASYYDTYRDLDYVASQLGSLAEQIAAQIKARAEWYS